MELSGTIIPLRGAITVRALDLRGTCVYRYDSPNTITFTAPLVLMDLLSNEELNVADAATNSIAIGNAHPLDASRGFANSVDLVEESSRSCIRYMRVGIGNQPAERGQVALASQFDAAGSNGCSFITHLEFPTNASMRFITTFSAAKAVHATIQEVSLWTRGSAYTENLSLAQNDSRMFARQIHPAINKTAAMTLEYTWTIYFT